MSLDEGITSEVNASIISEISPDSAYVTTKFIAIIPKKPHSSSSASSKAVFDDDGDLVRDCNEDEIEFVIKHKLSTDLRGVGYQVWRGALLMSDYIIANVGNGFTKKSVLEIGAGTGLASIALSHFCSDDSYIYATDLPELVDLLKDNLDSNNSKNIEVFPLDLKDTKDNAAFQEIDIVIGADVIYDNDVTDGVINFLLAPMLAGGFICGTKRRYTLSWGITIFVIIFVILMRRLPDDLPWKCFIDIGVVVGLSWGLVFILIWWFKIGMLNEWPDWVVDEYPNDFMTFVNYRLDYAQSSTVQYLVSEKRN